MITAAERAWMNSRAYVLEQVPAYVEAVTGAEPHLYEGHLVLTSGSHLVVVGFPLEGDFDAARLDALVRKAARRFGAGSLSLLAPAIPACMAGAAREARDRKGRLAAFDLAELAARDYVFYAFNFRSRTRAVPGASDLLLHALIEDAIRAGRAYAGLGLGTTAGVTYFKTKWGGTPHLDHVGCTLADATALRD